MSTMMVTTVHRDDSRDQPQINSAAKFVAMRRHGTGGSTWACGVLMGPRVHQPSMERVLARPFQLRNQSPMTAGRIRSVAC